MHNYTHGRNAPNAHASGSANEIPIAHAGGARPYTWYGVWARAILASAHVVCPPSTDGVEMRKTERSHELMAWKCSQYTGSEFLMHEQQEKRLGNGVPLFVI